MKKKLLLIIFTILMFSPQVMAATIENMTIDITVDTNGDATITETWNLKSQNINELEKIWSGDNLKISDIKITDQANTEFSSSKKFDKTKANIYTYTEDEIKKTLQFTVDGKDNTYNISYKIQGVISKYTDIEGFNYLLLSRTPQLNVSSLIAYVRFSTPLNESNTALYIHGSDASPIFKDGYIQIYSNSLKPKSQIRLMTTFNELNFPNAIPIKQTFNEYYEEVINTNEILEEIKHYLSNTTIKYILIAIIAILVLAFIIKFLTRFKKHDEYTGIITENKKTVTKLEYINYHDSIPCNGDLYKIAFLAGYFKITKNRSNLVGAIILKWIYEGVAEIDYDKNRPYIKFKPTRTSDRKLDMDLYGILTSASTYNILDGSKLTRYASEHYLRVITWFNMGFNETISDEFSRGNIKKIKKFSKVQLVLTDKLIDEANKIQGLKRYLLNFNQVPRQTELTEQGYRYLLICAELLGIGYEVAKEILRKNPDNALAKQLLELSQARYIYKSLYQTALVPYKQVAKSKKLKLAYDPEFDTLLNNRNTGSETRTSRL